MTVEKAILQIWSMDCVDAIARLLSFNVEILEADRFFGWKRIGISFAHYVKVQGHDKIVQHQAIKTSKVFPFDIYDTRIQTHTAPALLVFFRKIDGRCSMRV